MAEGKYEPVVIDLTPDGLYIKWQDGYESILPHRYLRGNCGCAQCVDEITHVRKVGISDVASNIVVEEFMEIGRYAIGILFSDLHETGIYPYKMLRDLTSRLED